MDKLTRKWIIIGSVWGVISLISVMLSDLFAARIPEEPPRTTSIVEYVLFLPGFLFLLIPSGILLTIPAFLRIPLILVVLPILTGALIGIGIAQFIKMKSKTNINKPQ